MRYSGLVLATALLLGGCAHHDVLVFGTDTAFAIDVQTAAAQGGSPSVTIGYKRKEAVWMPLLVNGQESRALGCAPGAGPAGSPPPTPCPPGNAPLDDPKYRATTTVGAPGGPTVTHSNAYSVVASLGAKFNGAATGGANASGGIAQFFATGVAADNLTANDAFVTALKLDGTAEAARAQADAVTAVAASRSGASISEGLSPAQITTITEGAKLAHAKHEKQAYAVLACATKDDGTDQWTDLVEASGVPAADKPFYKKIDPADRLQRLVRNQYLNNQLAAAGKASPFNCPGV